MPALPFSVFLPALPVMTLLSALPTPLMIAGAEQRQPLDIGAERERHRAVDLVDALIGRLDHAFAGHVDEIEVVAGAAVHGVGAGPAVEHVVTGKTVEGVGAGVAVDGIAGIVAGAADISGSGQVEHLDIGAEREAHRRTGPIDAAIDSLHQGVQRAVDDERVVPGAAVHGVGAHATDEMVVAGIAEQHVVAGAAVDLIGSGAAVDDVAAVAGRCRRIDPEDVAKQRDRIEPVETVGAERGDAAVDGIGAGELARVLDGIDSDAVDHAQRPDPAGPEIREHVGALQPGRRPVIDDAAGHHAAEVAAVFEHRIDIVAGRPVDVRQRCLP